MLYQIAFAAACCVGVAASSVTGATIVDDPFTDGSPAGLTQTGSNDPLDAHWAGQNNEGTLSVVDDTTGLGGGNALRFAAGGGFRGFGGVFDTGSGIAIATDERITLTFDFRFETASGGAVRFGLYNVGTGNNFNLDGMSSFGAADGYRFDLSQAGGTGGFSKETADDGSIGAGTPGGTFTGTTTDGTAAAALGTSNHAFVYDIARQTINGTDTLTIQTYLDGVLLKTQTDTANLITTYHLIGFGHGNNTPTYLIDNVRLETNPIPEPMAVSLLTLAAPALLRRRRRAQVARAPRGRKDFDVQPSPAPHHAGRVMA